MAEERTTTRGMKVAPRREALVKRRSKREKLTNADDQIIYQTYMALGNMAKTARECGVTEKTAYGAVARIKRNYPVKQQQELAQEGIQAMREVVTDKTFEILESITEDDLKSGRIPEYDKNGNVRGYKYYGPSLLQKATAVGIFTDKVKVLNDIQRGVSDDVGSGSLIMPETADQLIAAIKNRASSISMLQINLRKDNPDLATRVAVATGEEVPQSAAEEEIVYPDAGPFDNQ